MNKLSSKHFMFFILGSCMIALRCYSSIFVKLGGRDTWILSFFSSIIILFFMIYLIKILKKNNNYDINNVFLSLPNLIGKLFKLIFAIGLFIVAVESASVQSSSTHTNFFLSTPTWYCLLFFVIPGIYVLTRKLNAILILVITTVSISFIGDIVLFALMSQYLDLSNLMPILKDGLNQNYFICILIILGSLSSITITLPYLKFLDDDKNILRYSSLSIVISSLLIITSFISIITFFGPERGSNIFYPEYVESQIVEIANFIEFGEIFYIFRNVCLLFLKYIISSFGITLLYKDIIKNKKIFLICYSILVFVTSLLLTENQFYFFNYLKIINLILLIPFIIIPLISFTVFSVKNKTRH